MGPRPAIALSTGPYFATVVSEAAFVAVDLTLIVRHVRLPLTVLQTRLVVVLASAWRGTPTKTDMATAAAARLRLIFTNEHPTPNHSGADFIAISVRAQHRL